MQYIGVRNYNDDCQNVATVNNCREMQFSFACSVSNDVIFAMQRICVAIFVGVTAALLCTISLDVLVLSVLFALCVLILSNRIRKLGGIYKYTKSFDEQFLY